MNLAFPTLQLFITCRHGYPQIINRMPHTVFEGCIDLDGNHKLEKIIPVRSKIPYVHI